MKPKPNPLLYSFAVRQKLYQFYRKTGNPLFEMELFTVIGGTGYSKDPRVSQSIPVK